MKKSLFWAISMMVALSACEHNSSSTVLPSSSSTSMTLSQVPQSVKDWVANKYAGYRIHEVEQESEHGQIQYKLDIRDGNDNRKKLIFDRNWQFLYEKT
jgi:uncharacterized membrane protein YkoI